MVRVSSAQGDTYLKLYLSCADDALLRYEPASLAAEWSHFSATNAYANRLKSGQEPLLEYVKKVLRNGELRVLVRSAFWSPFRVDANGVRSGIGVARWPREKRFALGPLFTHADDAARAARQQVGAYVGRQYLGGILLHQASASFVPIEPLEDGPESNAASRLFYSGPGGPIAEVTGPGAQPLPLPVFPADAKLGAVHQLYKTVDNPGAAFDLALADLQFSTEVLQKNAVSGASCYLSSRGGALLRFTPNYTASEAAILGAGLKAGVSVFLARLTSVSRLEVLDVDAYWKGPGRIAPATFKAPDDSTEPDHDEL